MNVIKSLSLLIVLGAACVTSSKAEAAYRHYYTTWSYHPTYNYHYVQYYYKPVVTYPTYNYHYCIYYPSQPRYVYYYNPYRNYYWGRYDTQEKGYSLLAEKDRKKELKDIPDAAFPKPGPMPAIPESTDGEKMVASGIADDQVAFQLAAS